MMKELSIKINSNCRKLLWRTCFMMAVAALPELNIYPRWFSFLPLKKICASNEPGDIMLKNYQFDNVIWKKRFDAGGLNCLIALVKSLDCCYMLFTRFTSLRGLRCNSNFFKSQLRLYDEVCFFPDRFYMQRKERFILNICSFMS